MRKNVLIRTEKRETDGKGKLAIQVDIDGEYYRNIWALTEEEITPSVLSAIKNAVNIGADLARDEIAESINNLSFSCSS